MPLNLYYSANRSDHFLTTTNCDECENLYVFIRIEVRRSVVELDLLALMSRRVADQYTLNILLPRATSTTNRAQDAST